jgi:oxygen-dependent protoporphyrinogen oxidase
MKLTIIGGGITGLAAAYYASKQNDIPVEITLLEKADYWGGKLVTDRVPFEEGQFIIEGGPDTFVVTKPWGVRLCRQLGLEERLRGTNPETKKTYILKNNTLHELPGGLTMMIPTEFGPMLRSGLLSWPEKARMGMDFFLPAAIEKSDETMGDFVTRRLGRAAYESLIEPLMSGIYAGDGDKLSLQATLPYLRDLELKYGGLVKGALAVRKERAKKSRINGNHQPSTPNSRSIFLTPLSGLGEIVERLIEELVSANVDMRLNCRVSQLHQDPITAGCWNVELESGEVLKSEAVILAAPAFVSGELIDNINPELAAELSDIEYVSTATVTLAFREDDLPSPLDGYGYVIPRREGRKALACTWTSTKFPHRAPEGTVLVRVFVGRAGQEQQITWDDEALLEIAREELQITLGITAEPLLTRIYQWEKAMPQYNLGHPERLMRINKALEELPGLGVAGNGYHGIGIPDCIHSGETAVEQIVAALKMATEKEALKE